MGFVASRAVIDTQASQPRGFLHGEIRVCISRNVIIALPCRSTITERTARGTLGEGERGLLQLFPLWRSVAVAVVWVVAVRRDSREAAVGPSRKWTFRRVKPAGVDWHGQWQRLVLLTVLLRDPGRGRCVGQRGAERRTGITARWCCIVCSSSCIQLL